MAPETTNRVCVRFLRGAVEGNCSYQAGERAGFMPARAAALIEAGYAEPGDDASLAAAAAEAAADAEAKAAAAPKNTAAKATKATTKGA